MLETLVYVSSAAVELSEQELVDILTASRRNNSRNNVTGMLLYRVGFFIQALEGDRDVLDTLYAKIEQDPRHDHIVVVYRNAIQERLFAEWQMGFKDLGTVDPADYPGFTDILTQPLHAGIFTQNPSRTAKLLESFANQTYY